MNHKKHKGNVKTIMNKDVAHKDDLMFDPTAQPKDVSDSNKELKLKFGFDPYKA